MRDTKDLQQLVKAIVRHMPGWSMDVDKHANVTIHDKVSLCVLNINSEWQNNGRGCVTVDWPRESSNVTRPDNVYPRPDDWETHPVTETTFAKDRGYTAIARQILKKLEVAIRQYRACKVQSDKNVMRKQACDNAAVALAAEVGGKFSNDQYRRDHEKATVYVDGIGDLYTHDGKRWSFDRGISGLSTEKVRAILAIVGDGARE